MVKKTKKAKKSAAAMIERAKKELEKKKSAKAQPKPQKPLVKVSAAEANERTANIKQIYSTMGNLWWKLGVEIKKAIDDRVPEARGQSAHEWMTECFGDGWQKMYRAHRAVKALSGVEPERLQKISEGNAYVLARLPEKIRTTNEWVKKATELPNEKFAEAAEKYTAKRTGIQDPNVKILDALGFSKIAKSFAEIIKETIALACKEMNTDPSGAGFRADAVEAIFAEYLTNHQEVPGTIDETVQEGSKEEEGEAA